MKSFKKEIFDNRGMLRQDFYLNMENFPDWFSILIDSAVKEFDFDVGLIIFGFDVNQELKTVSPHIYELSNSGERMNWDSTGFAMNGIGYYQSISEITKEPYDPTTSLSNSILKVYYSKKSAERMTGVGSYTDLGVMEIFIDSNGKIIVKNSLGSEGFKKSIDEKFKEQREKVKEIESDIKTMIDSAFTQPVEKPKPVEKQNIENKST